jgi:hypothetical protein
MNCPKWYKGEIKQVGNPTDKVREIRAGADLEQHEVPGGDPSKKQNMLVLGRTQQVLIQVDQEKTEKAGMATSPGEGDLAAGLNPIPLRWVDLSAKKLSRRAPI